MSEALHPTPQIVRRGAGVPLVFVHGNGVDHRMMRDLDDAFDTDGEWERIYLDLPGFGGASALPDPGGLPEMADWLDTAVGEILGTDPFAIVGASLGALLARELVSRRKTQCLGMALLAPVVDSVPEHRTLPEAVLLVEDVDLLGSLPEEDAASYSELAVVQSTENWERFSRAVLPGLRAANAAAVERLWNRYALDTLPDDDLTDFDLPVLIVTGRQDAVVGYHDQWRLAQRLPQATFVMLDYAGHNVQIDQPEAVRDLLRTWASGVRRGHDLFVSPSASGAVPGLHHIELWVADFEEASAEWGWLLERLGFALASTWPGGESWRADGAYLTLTTSPNLVDPLHDRRRAGLNHLAFHAGGRAEVDRLMAEAPRHGWKPLYHDRYPHAGGDEPYAGWLENSAGFKAEVVADGVR